MTDRISPTQFLETDGVEDWRVVGNDGACAYFMTGSFAESARLVQAIGGLAGVDDHQVAIDVRIDAVARHAPGWAAITRGSRLAS